MIFPPALYVLLIIPLSVFLFLNICLPAVFFQECHRILISLASLALRLLCSDPDPHKNYTCNGEGPTRTQPQSPRRVQYYEAVVPGRSHLLLVSLFRLSNSARLTAILSVLSLP